MKNKIEKYIEQIRSTIKNINKIYLMFQIEIDNCSKEIEIEPEPPYKKSLVFDNKQNKVFLKKEGLFYEKKTLLSDFDFSDILLYLSIVDKLKKSETLHNIEKLFCGFYTEVLDQLDNNNKLNVVFPSLDFNKFRYLGISGMFMASFKIPNENGIIRMDLRFLSIKNIIESLKSLNMINSKNIEEL